MDTKLINKVVDLCMLYQIKQSELFVKVLDKQIGIYQKEIEYLKQTKPRFFEKKKLKEHNSKIEYYENKILESYKKLDQEVNDIFNMYENINS